MRITALRRVHLVQNGHHSLLCCVGRLSSRSHLLGIDHLLLGYLVLLHCHLHCAGILRLRRHLCGTACLVDCLGGSIVRCLPKRLLRRRHMLLSWRSLLSWRILLLSLGPLLSLRILRWFLTLLLPMALALALTLPLALHLARSFPMPLALAPFWLLGSSPQPPGPPLEHC